MRNFHHQILVFPVDPLHNNLTKKNRKLFLFPTYGMVNCETSLHFPNPECVCMKSLRYISTFTMTSIFISTWNWLCWLCWQKLAMGQAKNQYHNHKEGQFCAFLKQQQHYTFLKNTKSCLKNTFGLKIKNPYLIKSSNDLQSKYVLPKYASAYR